MGIQFQINNGDLPSFYVGMDCPNFCPNPDDISKETPFNNIAISTKGPTTESIAEQARDKMRMRQDCDLKYLKDGTSILVRRAYNMGAVNYGICLISGEF